MLWLYDSRDSKYGKRKLHILPLTPEGKRKAWDIVLTAEFPTQDEVLYLVTREDYQYLAINDSEGGEPSDPNLFNDYWAEYGWYLMPVDADAEVPHDAEVVTPESERKDE